MKDQRRAFTLIEVIVAVAIIGMIALSLQRIVTAGLTAMSVSSERELETEQMTALYRYMDRQLQELPKRGQSLILGASFRQGANALNTDELQWRARPGAGTLTSAGEGEWFVTLALMPQSQGSRIKDLGIRRRKVEASEKEYDWVPLVQDVAGLKFEYYDPRLNAWLERWTDQNSQPLLIRMLLWKTKESLPERKVFTVTSSYVQQR
jgi:prepilin-type N-terminal cleavage/methylation domain-containing protein